MSYTPVFQKPYPDGWENLPSEDTPITAEALDGYDEAIVNIENYLEDNEIISVEANPQDASTESLTKIKIGGTVYTVSGGGGLLPHLYIDSEAGSTVTVVAPDSSVITPTQISSGHWECDVPSYGVYTIHAVLNGDDAVLSLTVDDVKEYHVTDSHYSYTLNVYAPTGSTIRVTTTGETYTGTGAGSNPVQFALHQASTTYSIQVTLDGVSKTDSVTTPSTSGGTGSKTLEFGTINVTLDTEFVGETITCVNGGTTISKTASSTSLVFHPPTTGTWSISGTVSGTTYSVDAEVVDLSTPVSVSLETSQTVTVTLYSATEDTVTFTDASGVQKTEVFASGQSSKSIDIEINLSGSTITFTSSVAKNPDDLSQYYSKALTVTASTTELYLMPSNTLYWWGWIEGAQVVNEGTTLETYDIYQPASTSYKRYMTNKQFDITDLTDMCAVVEGAISGAYHNIIGLYSAPDMNTSYRLPVGMSQFTTKQKYTADISSLNQSVYVGAYVEANATYNTAWQKIYALWFE